MNYYIKIAGIVCCVTIFSSCQKSTSGTHSPEQQAAPAIVHKAHLPEGWYTLEKQALTQEIGQYLALAAQAFPCPVAEQDVRALIVPHAGHRYSGLCAATSYQTLLEPDQTLPLEQRKNKTIKRVIILSPSHTHFFNGVALPDYTAYKTVLGTINVDTGAIAILKKNNVYKEFPDAHHKEHAIEIQLPFLQETIADFTIVPLIVGHLKDEDEIDELCQRLERIIDPQTLVVVSSDFTHYGQAYEYTPFVTDVIPHLRSLDGLAISTLMQQSFPLFSTFLTQTNATICGREAIKVFLALVSKKSFKQNLTAQLTCYYTSPQIQAVGELKSSNCSKLLANIDVNPTLSSVSYAGMVFSNAPSTECPPDQRLTGYEKQSLLILARTTLENSFLPKSQQLALHFLNPVVTPALQQSVGAFVTLTTKKKTLRGCIGRIITTEPLYKTVQTMALAAAFQDSRFSALTEEELGHVILDITVLTKPKKIESYNDIELGKHGIILHKHNEQGQEIGSALFLPQVPREQRWDLETTLEELSHKAGFAYDAWQKDCSFEIFEGFEIKELSSEEAL